ncbi:MAG: hypothetical protein AABW45_01900 [Nanoarchaeota archaeon]
MKIKEKKLRNRLRIALSKRMNDKIHISEIRNVQVVEAPSRNFNIARFTLTYRKDSNDKNEKVKLILKRLKPNLPKTDFSHKQTSIHREIEHLPEYTRRLFEYIQGPINNGHEEGYLVNFYGQEGGEIYEEDAGDISVERLFIEKTPTPKLLERLVEAIAIEHSKWAVNMTSHVDELGEVRREKNFREKLHDNLDFILKYYNKELRSSDEDLLAKFFLGTENYLNDPVFNIFFRIIHSDLHLGHIFLKYNGKKFSDIKDISKEDLRKYEPKIKIVDLTGMSIGPQTFDLVDMLKHPVSVNAEDYPTQTSQRKFVEDLVELYRTKRVEAFLETFLAEVKNGEPVIKKSLEFLTKFYISNIYRDIRATSKGILLKSDPRNKELYKIYKKSNPKYDFYSDWYLADLGEVLKYLISEKFNDDSLFKGHLTQKIIEQTYDILLKHIPSLEENPIKLSKQIVNY